MDSLASSKTMKLILIGIGVCMAIFVLAAIAQALFNITLPFVTETFTAITAQTGIGTARNAYVDRDARTAINTPLPTPPAQEQGERPF